MSPDRLPHPGGWREPDWSRPWFGPYAQHGSAVCAALAAGCPLPQALNARPSQPGGPRFVPQAALPAGQAYEAFVFDTAQVPTREGLHDFFNGLCWLHFPLTKRRLNQLQAGDIARTGVRPVRGPLRDAITLFDENAVLLQAPDALWQALLARDWLALFGALRPLWAQARPVLLGHALLEKLVQPYKAITGHVFREPVPLSLGPDLAGWDRWLVDRLSDGRLAEKPFTPLPVLGVPGWWADNETPSFYADGAVFRAPRAPSGRR